MSTDLENEVLYIPKIASGNPVKGGISLGFLAITRSAVMFIPTHTHSMTHEDNFSGRVTLETMDVKEYQGIPFWKVVPTKAETMPADELDEFLEEMAGAIEGSKRIPLSDLQNINFGWMNVTFEAGEQTFKVNPGIGSPKKKKIKKFASARQIGQAGGYTAPTTSPAADFSSPAAPKKGKKGFVWVAVAGLVLSIGVMGDAPSSSSSSSDKLTSVASKRQPQNSSETRQRAKRHLSIGSSMMKTAEMLRETSTVLLDASESHGKSARGLRTILRKKAKMGVPKPELRKLAKQVWESQSKERKALHDSCVALINSAVAGVDAQHHAIQANEMLLKVDPKNKASYEKNLQTARDTLKLVGPVVYQGTDGCPGFWYPKKLAERQLTDKPGFALRLSPKTTSTMKHDFHRAPAGKKTWYYRADVRNTSKEPLTVTSVDIFVERDGKWWRDDSMDTVDLKKFLKEQDLVSDAVIMPNTTAASFVSWHSSPKSHARKLKWVVKAKTKAGKTLKSETTIQLAATTSKKKRKK